ncbi:MAG: hypothetical protein JGK24_02400 [Microcoleus sp. PH2017_29_MFU_D_A]|jgi:hypothetical protein|uniref:hypothetical protein n=1 Tax=unclassified Microcoleus TaxID=2642155 RepID=UPI001DFCAD78|nr:MULTISPECIES: hypothetical protein [unclassified Microcoleus]MCC3418450.1 hypothetical protein [Microcoleus sp. PH2017_07_MST_O_A]TAE72249.1 MAG: hypothetical protein EAZ86_00300 [Oscillatoriales cyanobacterium]MCC3422813.1 hypothetical protein [Microcoleus sp. PH2017_01_SCD_O_A]MCC3572099.1 hypothetical protein [Microcoleus sp. PH2017_34_RAT_O_A]MCC3584738.1 hypothetical protein [Microcoleus sp. PH2017_30_WIL_O_A]
MNQGAIPDEEPRNLPEQLLLQDAKVGNCIVIHCGTDKLLGDAPRLVALYGGNSEDWDKMTSIEAFEVNGYSVQVHWFRNSQTFQEVEFKFKRQYPKTAPKNM